ncbi:MAG: hypothetical protein US76_00345 [Parcubacteria group bacterium GW2011_GWA2_38_13b]|nr:MAG: hypothetical protein US76_00345 [Parcubacteria group bacterium GW2011_GWA2_38_13b]
MKYKISIIVVILFLAMTFLAIASVWNDSAIMDEASHIPAGYSYIVKKDMRINPEHPPLVKDLAGISALIYSKISNDKINFNDASRFWQNEINSQWSFGFNFLYDIGNNADNIIFWSRIPSILIMLILGFYIFKWARELYGPKAGLVALFLYALSPTVLTHGRFVTTDVSAAAGIFIATYYFIKALRNPSKKNIIISGIVLGIALLLKFSTFLLIPFFVLLIVIFTISRILNYPNANKISIVWKNALLLLMIFVIGAIILYPIYQYHVWNYPIAPATQEARNTILQIDNCANLNLEKYPVSQFRDTVCILKTYGNRPLVNFVTWMSDKPILRSYGQYLLGLMMVNQRTLGGNTTYFLGQVSNLGWHSYFPIVYLIKEPLTLHILTFIALIFALIKLAVYKWRSWRYAFNFCLAAMFKNRLREFSEFIPKNIAQIAMLIFIVIYWTISVRSRLNIGIRHILPTIPFVYVLISGNTINLIEKIKDRKIYFLLSIFYFLLFGWYLYANLSAFPHYLAYFNETAGGSKNGYKYVVDSNLDWGQDLKRLAIWVNKNNVNKIKLDYFGGGNPKYYLGDKFEPWRGSRPENEALGGWLAVSATFLQGGRGNSAPGFKEQTDYYKWLNKYTPATVIGHSIFVYNLTNAR